MPSIDPKPIIRAMSEAAPRIRIVTMSTPQRAVNCLFGNSQIVLTARRLDITITGLELMRVAGGADHAVNPVDIGRAVIAFLMNGELGAYVSRSDNEKDCILGVYEKAEIEGNVLSMYLAVAHEAH